jgi:glycosyltransferase involved in cell wall biosynthesis
MAPLLGPQVRLMLVGEGTARPEIEAAIEPKNRPWVVLTGARHDVPRLLCAFDLFASSSRTEGLPLALPEAMTSGLPIVATAVGGVPGIVPKDTGVLVPHGDDAALRGAIQRLLDDASARQKMGAAGRAYAIGRFAEERMVDAYLALYARGRR